VNEFHNSQIDNNINNYKNFIHKDKQDFGNNFENSDSRFVISNNYNSVSESNRNFDELKDTNNTANYSNESLIVINASEFCKNKDNKNFFNKEREFLNKRNLNKNKNKINLANKAENSSLVISDNHNSNYNSHNSSLMNSNNYLKGKSLIFELFIKTKY